MSWRPEEWEKTTFHLGCATPYKCTSNELRAFSDGVEAGADAMLEALKPKLKEISGLVSCIHGDWTDPRDECRAIQVIIKELISEEQP